MFSLVQNKKYGTDTREYIFNLVMWVVPQSHVSENNADVYTRPWDVERHDGLHLWAWHLR